MKKVMIMLMLLSSILMLSACEPPAPVDYPDTVWICEEPYMCFEASDDEIGITGIGEIQTDDGDKIEVRFLFERSACYVCRESDCFEIGADGKMHPVYPIGLAMISGNYKMYNAKVKIFPGNDQIYGGKYSVLEFHRQAKVKAK